MPSPRPAARARGAGRSQPWGPPHRAHGAPSLRYLSHLVAPGLSVIGAGEPFLPGISIGHNGTIAFGLTRFYIDQEDLYVYELDPARSDAYRYRDAFEPMTVVTEQVAVKGEPARARRLAFHRDGPVLHVDAESRELSRHATRSRYDVQLRGRRRRRVARVRPSRDARALLGLRRAR